MKLRSNRRAYERKKKLPHIEKEKNPSIVIAATAVVVICVLAFAFVSIASFTGFNINIFSNDEHVAFFINSSTVLQDGDKEVDMGAPVITKDGSVYLPVRGAVEALGGTLEYDSDTSTMVIKGIKSTATIAQGSSMMDVGLFGEKDMGSEVIVEGDSTYVPARPFLEALGFEVVYSDSTQRLDAFKHSVGKDEPPVCSLSTDKKKYAVGEKISFVTESSSPKGYDIVDEKWENMSPFYFEEGEVTVSYAVKDYKGNWSDPVEVTFSVAGEYEEAEEIPVITYAFIAKDSDDISREETAEREVKKMVEAPDPNDPSKTIQKEETKKETYTKVVKGKYYDDNRVISLEQFKEELSALDEAGINTLFVSDYLEYVDCGVLPPAGSVIILFRSGYESTYELAYPLLKQYGFKFNLALEVSNTEQRSLIAKDKASGNEDAASDLEQFDKGCDFPYLTFDEVKTMADSGLLEIGAVGYDSNYSIDGVGVLSAPLKYEETGEKESQEDYIARIDQDVALSYETLKSNLGKHGDKLFYVYPMGEANDELIAALDGSGFEAAFGDATDHGITADDWALCLPRITVYQDMSLSKFNDIYK